jgi:hypothetical protein
MVYVTQTEIEQFTGFSYGDFKLGNRNMTEAEFEEFMLDLIPRVEQMIHRYCNVLSFSPTVNTEYHDGRGPTDDTSGAPDYTDLDKTYGIYYNVITTATFTAEEQTAAENAIPVWSARTLQTSLVAGDYRLITRNEYTKAYFFANVPKKGTANVRFTYYTGYSVGSPQYEEIRLAVLRACANALLLKKKMQEATTVRNYGTRDYSQMFDVFNEASILNENIKLTLDRYKRVKMPGIEPFC